VLITEGHDTTHAEWFPADGLTGRTVTAETTWGGTVKGVVLHSTQTFVVIRGLPATLLALDVLRLEIEEGGVT
jgi:hypothetical protein